MWILGRLKKKELLVDSKIIYAKYNKILLIIKSCTTLDHIESCRKIISNYEKWCTNINLEYRTYKMLINFLNKTLEIKFKSLLDRLP